MSRIPYGLTTRPRTAPEPSPAPAFPREVPFVTVGVANGPRPRAAVSVAGAQYYYSESVRKWVLLDAGGSAMLPPPETRPTYHGDAFQLRGASEGHFDLKGAVGVFKFQEWADVHV